MLYLSDRKYEYLGVSKGWHVFQRIGKTEFIFVDEAKFKTVKGSELMESLNPESSVILDQLSEA